MENIKNKKSIIIKNIMIVCVLFSILTSCNEKKTSVKKNMLDASYGVEAKNLIFNPSFEKKVSSTRNDKTFIEKPDGWKTYKQLLNNSMGWCSTEKYKGKRSLEITNTANTTAYWKGKAVTTKKPFNALQVSVWVKVAKLKDETRKGKVQLAFDFYLQKKNNKTIKRRVAIDIPKKNMDWKKIEGKFFFTDNIVKIVPYLCLSKMTGTVWFDDLCAYPLNVNFKMGKLLLDSNNEKSLDIKPLSTNTKSSKDKSKIYEVKGTQTLKSSDFIAIEKGKIYKLSGEFRAVGKGESRFFFGYFPYTENKEVLTSQSFNFIKGTGTELVRPCKDKDKIIYVKDAQKWVSNKNGRIAFETDNSGNYSDIPNINLSSSGINKIEKSNNCYKLFLAKAVGKTYPVGTKIREHGTGSVCVIYNVANYELLTKRWNYFDNLITINNSSFVLPEFDANMKYIKVFILANYQNKNAKMQFKNLKLEEVKVEGTW